MKTLVNENFLIDQKIVLYEYENFRFLHIRIFVLFV